METRIPECISFWQPEICRDVLIIGGGLAGMESALKLSQKGHHVILVEREESLGGLARNLYSFHCHPENPQVLLAERQKAVEENPNIEVLTQAQLVDFEGQIGNFTAWLDHHGNKRIVKAGAVIVATGFQSVFCPVKYGLRISEQVIGLLKLEKQLLEGRSFKHKRVTFVVGKTSENHILSFVNALKNAILLHKDFTAIVNIFYKNMKVAADNLELIYNEARDLGINFYSYINSLEIVQGSGEVVINYQDPFLGAKIPGIYKVYSDLVVLPEDLAPADDTDKLKKLLKIESDNYSFFGEENVHYIPELTPLEGIYLVGGCQSPGLLNQLELAVEIVAGEISRKLLAETRNPAKDYPIVDDSKCAVCLTCYRSCPHNAVTIEHNPAIKNIYQAAARMNPLACKRCGICTAECPGKAIQLPGYSDIDILAKLAGVGG